MYRTSFHALTKGYALKLYPMCLIKLFFPFFLAQPAHRWRSDSSDLSQMYASATPNPTGSLSGPWFELEFSGNVTGVAGKTTHLACRVKNLGNQTVRRLLVIWLKA